MNPTVFGQDAKRRLPHARVLETATHTMMRREQQTKDFLALLNNCASGKRRPAHPMAKTATFTVAKQRNVKQRNVKQKDVKTR